MPDASGQCKSRDDRARREVGRNPAQEGRSDPVSRAGDARSPRRPSIGQTIFSAADQRPVESGPKRRDSKSGRNDAQASAKRWLIRQGENAARRI